MLVDVRRRVTLLPQPVRNGVEPQLGRLDVRDLAPTRAGSRPARRAPADRVARGDRAVARVLVVVDEDAVALLLPPFAGGVLRQAPLDLARQRQRRAADLDVVPARLDPDVDVDATRARGLRIADQSVLLEDVLDAHRHLADRVPAHPGHRVKIDPELVRTVEVGPAHRVRVEVDDAEVDRPDQMRRVVGDQLGRGSPAREGEGRGLQPVRRTLWHPLLEEELAVDAVDEALHRPGPLAQLVHRRLLDGDVVLGQVELGEPRLREEELVRVGQAHLVARDLDRRVVPLLCHRGHLRHNDRETGADHRR